MYNEGAPEFFVDHGFYYPTPASYGYVGTGFEQTGDWEDYHGVFGLDGQDMQYIGAGNENVPYLYYSPGYGQSPYNPYNPFIPGAMVGADGSFIAPQQYYAFPSYENAVASPAYQPMVLQSGPNNVANGTADSYAHKALSVSQVDGAKHNFSSNIRNSSHAVVGDTSRRRTSFARVPEGSRATTGAVKQPVPSFTSGTFSSQAAPQVLRARGAQGMGNGSSEKMSSGGTQLSTGFLSTNGLSSFNSSHHSRSISKAKPKLLYGRAPDDGEHNPDLPSEKNQGPRTNKSKNQLVVKARTTMAGNPDAQGNIYIFVDQYNSVDFPIDYKYAEFFVIKSYSEDDVHKSIKYNVWSSTPNGNKKLNAAYEGAQRMAAGDPRGCPIFFFFSVNASGQFCGVAEMTGPVDFGKDMDFWQQDKWSGCFPVKWHFIKDLPNPNFRHIILENNENKPVTNSRDTTEIPYKKGLEMLRIFRNYTSKTSLLDDFMYYENRQCIMQEERARMLITRDANPYLVPFLDPPRKLQPIHDYPSVGDVHVTKHDEFHSSSQNKTTVDANSSATKHSVPLGHNSSDTNNCDSTVSTGSNQVLADAIPKMVDELKISSLNINSQEPESESSVATAAASSTLNSESSFSTAAAASTLNSESLGVVTIGSMPVKVKDIEFSTFLTVGTIPLDPRALQRY